MKRMLANQYYMARDFRRAIPLLKKALERYPGDLSLLSKLVISYVAEQKLKKALPHLRILLSRLPPGYFSSISVDENCPCPDLIERWRQDPPANLSREELYVSLAILELFCGGKNVVNYLRAAKAVAQDWDIVDDLLNYVEPQAMEGGCK